MNAFTRAAVWSVGEANLPFSLDSPPLDQEVGAKSLTRSPARSSAFRAASLQSPRLSRKP